MLDKIRTAIDDKKLSDHIGKADFYFKANIEIPSDNDLVSDIFKCTNRPCVVVFPNIESQNILSENEALAYMDKMKRIDVDTQIARQECAFVPAKLFDKTLLRIPDLNVITMEGRQSWDDMQEEVANDLLRLGKLGRVTMIDVRNSDFLLPLNTFKQLWDIEKLIDIGEATSAYDFEGVNKQIAARLLGEVVSYIEQHKVNTKRAEFKLNNHGMHFTIL